MCWHSVVFPDDSGPKISVTRPRGTPPTPSARSSASDPVEIVSPARGAASPPLPPPAPPPAIKAGFRPRLLRRRGDPLFEEEGGGFAAPFLFELPPSPGPLP